MRSPLFSLVRAPLGVAGVVLEVAVVAEAPVAAVAGVAETCRLKRVDVSEQSDSGLQTLNLQK
jgi:hypothetical protein